jgi:hypothetical protein
MPGKRVQFDEETWQALQLLARDQMKTFQELADDIRRPPKKEQPSGRSQRRPAQERRSKCGAGGRKSAPRRRDSSGQESGAFQELLIITLCATGEGTWVLHYALQERGLGYPRPF